MNDLLLARYTVETLLYRYALVLDNGPLEHWPRSFTEDGRYRLIPRENFAQGLPAALMLCTSRAMMEDRVTAIEKASVFTPHTIRHLYTNVLVDEAQAGRAVARANYAVYRSVQSGETDLLSVGWLEARVRLEPTPLFESMDVIYETCRIPGLVVYPL
ncbi:MAG TPA: aromatic-ring-hydroxylating dioxygenase subunit beta [Myxococcaceae bacterium]|jgi:3-phenylpropionate/cinnamic acid dioxygenase small subunit